MFGVWFGQILRAVDQPVGQDACFWCSLFARKVVKGEGCCPEVIAL